LKTRVSGLPGLERTGLDGNFPVTYAARALGQLRVVERFGGRQEGGDDVAARFGIRHVPPAMERVGGRHAAVPGGVLRGTEPAERGKQVLPVARGGKPQPHRVAQSERRLAGAEALRRGERGSRLPARGAQQRPAHFSASR
jgi:hypothetical protein